MPDDDRTRELDISAWLPAQRTAAGASARGAGAPEHDGGGAARGHKPPRAYPPEPESGDHVPTQILPAVRSVRETDFAVTEVARTEVARTEVAQTEVAQTEVARTEVARTEVAQKEVARTEVAEPKTAEPKTAEPAAPRAAAARIVANPADARPARAWPADAQPAKPSWLDSDETMVLPIFVTRSTSDSLPPGRASTVEPAPAVAHPKPSPPAVPKPDHSDRLPSDERNMLIFVAALLLLGTLAIVAMASVGR